MKKILWFTFATILITGLFYPFVPRTVVPEWELVFIDENGEPIPFTRLDQHWKDYSLEYISANENDERNLQSDQNGYIKLPARHIKVSVFQILSSNVRDFVMEINPHASFGPSSYIVCRGTRTCLVSYKSGQIGPESVVIK
jgi:hypothetical protein